MTSRLNTLAWLLLLSFLGIPYSSTSAQPNILFILTEDQGAHMGALGTTDVKTPHMDALAASGALFRRAYVAYPVCSASKACIMTGLHSHTNGLVNNTNNFLKPATKLTEAEKNSPPYLHTRIRSSGLTMVEVLVANGYHTAVCGKLHVSPNERFPYHDFLPKGASKQALTGIIKRAAGKPWFLLHNSITFTHRPFVNSEKQSIGIDPAKVTIPAHLPDRPTARRDWAEYLDGVQRNDVAVGEVLASLRESGQESNTIIIFMGDHGPAYQHGKMTPFHFGLHIPLIIRLPGAKPLVSDALVSELDLLPTLLDVLGIRYASPLHGMSLRPLIEGKANAKGHDFIFSEVSGRSLNQKRGMEERSVLDETHQLIVRAKLTEPKVINADLRDMKPWINRIYGETVRVKAQFPEAFRILSEMDPHALGGKPPAVELYDLEADPFELHNLAHVPAHRPHLERLFSALEQWSTSTNDDEFKKKTLLSLAMRGFADEPATYAPPISSMQVGDLKFEWHDPRRDRDVPAKIYFPKEGAGPFPVIIFSHGLGGSRDGYEYLGRHWAGCGYVSVHLQHIDSDDSVWKNVPVAERGKALQKGAANLASALNRPPDAQFAIDQIEKLNADDTSPLKSRLDLKAIAIAGHSFGGHTTLALAGQTFILPLWMTRRCDEPRIKAAIQMSAPAPANRSDMDKSYGSITIPTMHMTGTKDFLEVLPQTTAADRRIPFDRMSHSETCLVIFNGGDHFIFSGRERVVAKPEKLAQDAVFQKLICAGTTAFWDGYLKNNAAAKSWLLDGGYAKLLGEQATFEMKTPEPGSK